MSSINPLERRKFSQQHLTHSNTQSIQHMAPKLFQPLRVGRMDLHHRIVMPPLTRNRATSGHLVTDPHVEHYALRAAVPGTFLITEATYVTPRDAGSDWRNTPGIWSDEQIAAWKKVGPLSAILTMLFTNITVAPGCRRGAC